MVHRKQRHLLTHQPQGQKKRDIKKDSFKIAVVNCQSINNKIPELLTFVSSTDPDTVLGTESCLKPEILNCEVFPEEYTVYRKDRDIRHKLKGGGVFILVRIFLALVKSK